jgi:ABC-type lipoprotein release transport system permease subunit
MVILTADAAPGCQSHAKGLRFMRIAYLGFKELAVRWRAVLAMGLTISLPILTFLLLNGYQTGLESRYEKIQENYLLVQQTGSMGEFYGSRLPASLSEKLSQQGISWMAAELHTITGTTPENAILLRGVQLKNYSIIEEYQMIEGRPLQPGDPPRLAMIGVKLAEQRNAYPGDSIQIRGRDFSVIGVFANGTYADYEAWISIEDAQTLMGWGSDVSVYIIPANENLKVGDSLPGGVSIVQKGESGQNLISEWKPLYRLLGIITATLGVAVAVALTNILWRLAWLRRRELAILQSIGFGRLSMLWYLFVQGLGITTIGFCLGVIEAIIVGSLIPLRTAGISIDAVIDLNVFLSSLILAGLITLAGSGIPAYWFSQQNLVQLMKVEG